METNKIYIISIILTIISLLYSLLNYLGIIRYISLYTYPVEAYIKNYKNLDKIGKHRTIISLTTTPEQMKKLTPTIKSLLDQTVKVDLISIIIPQGDEYKLPSKLKDSVSIFNCGEDKGILNCIIPAITRETESTTRIITLSSCKIYGKDFIETLMEASEENPNKIIYNNNKDYLDIGKGVVFSTKFFDEKFLHPPKDIDPNKWVNDFFKSFPKERIEYNENYKSI
jgi:hypothetical protein